MRKEHDMHVHVPGLENPVSLLAMLIGLIMIFGAYWLWLAIKEVV
jgi:Mg2+ and Co2+ transporter CorA